MGTRTRKATLDELAIDYEMYPTLFPDWDENKLAQDIRWNMLQKMLQRFSEDAVFAALGRALDIKKLLGA